MKLFDTHAHIGLIYDDPIEQLRVIQQAKQAGVARLISINNSLHDFERVYPNLKSIKGVYHAVGVAPSEVTTPGVYLIFCNSASGYEPEGHKALKVLIM